MQRASTSPNTRSRWCASSARSVTHTGSTAEEAGGGVQLRRDARLCGKVPFLPPPRGNALAGRKVSHVAGHLGRCSGICTGGWRQPPLAAPTPGP